MHAHTHHIMLVQKQVPRAFVFVTTKNTEKCIFQAPRGFAFVTFYNARAAREAVQRQRVTYKKGPVFAKMEVKVLNLFFFVFFSFFSAAACHLKKWPCLSKMQVKIFSFFSLSFLFPAAACHHKTGLGLAQNAGPKPL